ncbi:hypothetical protein F7725_013668 [Dissostichus mawsoni]|uniref:Uncharacterized protein n=1 Tax=Dissostichus mawsoni TaxID=36200 RepID=A0A7J5YU51_DISMA|nr:hypothetical protein F7725_013668 [Dissostichus mawsoni]
MDSLTFWLNLSLVAPSGLDDGPVPFGDDTQYPNAGYDVTKEGQTGLYDGPVPYDGATRYANAKPVSKDSQSGNPGFVSTGVAPEVISYGYGGYPFANMDESNTAPQEVLMDLFLMALRLVMPTQNLCQKTSNKTI